MSLYFIGDLQGCHEPLQRLLQTIAFSPSRDTLYLLGDLVNRGPASLEVVRDLAALGDAAQCLLGNHDLNLLAVDAGLRQPHRNDTLQPLLQASDRASLIDWPRHRAMALNAHGWLMVHAGVLPQWTGAQTMALAGEVERALRAPDYHAFLAQMYGNQPAQWRDDLQGAERLRVVVNALTRLRFCTADGEMEFSATGGALTAPPGYQPWFEVPGRLTSQTPIAFGHWSTLALDNPHGQPRLRSNTLGLDTGCLWGRSLTAARLGNTHGEFELFSVGCSAIPEPGAAAL